MNKWTCRACKNFPEITSVEEYVLWRICQLGPTIAKRWFLHENTNISTKIAHPTMETEIWKQNLESMLRENSQRIKKDLYSILDTMDLQMQKAYANANKTGTSKVGAISKAQKAQFSKYAQDVFMKSFENTFETPKVCLSCSIWLENHFSRLETKKIFENFFEIFFWKKFFLKKTSKMSHSAEKWKGGTLWDSLTYFLLQNI